MAQQKLEQKRVYVCISTSIANWREKILKRYGYPETRWPFFTDTIFFGLYHWVDYLRFIACRGTRIVFWAGSDILALERSYWKRIVARITAEHICENYVEQQKLRELGIEARIQPICLSTPYPKLSYKWSKDTHVYLTVRESREKEYGLCIVESLASKIPNITFHIFGAKNGNIFAWNVIYHGEVSEEKFNQDIKNYQACLRLNEHDGFGDALAKSVLMGQWPISVIAYSYITHAPGTKSLISALQELKNRKEPNYEGRRYWLKELSKDLI